MRFLTLSLLLIFSQAHADGLGKDQVFWANQACIIGEPYGLCDTLAAISGQESSYCRFKGTSWSRGCTGIKRRTARIFDPTVTREQLTNDNGRNLKDGLAYLLYCRQQTEKYGKNAWRAMVFCYHWGYPAFLQLRELDWTLSNDPYVDAIIKRMDEIKEDTE